jgi:hypothetical protein
VIFALGKVYVSCCRQDKIAHRVSNILSLKIMPLRDKKEKVEGKRG